MVSMQGPFATGAYPSARDYRDDYAAFAVAAATPTSGIMLPKSFHTDLGKDLYQSQIPACVSHSITYIIRLWWYRTHGEWVDFSPRFLDILSDEAWIPLNGGRVPRTVLKIAATRGICTTKTLANDTSLSISAYRDPKAISQEAYAEALKYKIPGYISVPLDLVKSRQAIFLYGALSGLYTVGQELYTPSWNPKDINPLKTPRTAISGHEMTPCGWKDTELNTLRNQWSPQWCNNDEADYDFGDWLPFTSEQWAIAQVPADVTDFLRVLPSPDSFHYNFAVDAKQGQTNETVRFAQIALMILGYLAPVAASDLGIFGPKTAAAVSRFQAASGISPVPSSIGPATRAALNKRFAI